MVNIGCRQVKNVMANIPDPIFEVANPKLYEGIGNPLNHIEDEFENMRNNLEDGWYFWDETWSDHHGPYSTEDIAREHLNKYCKKLNII